MLKAALSLLLVTICAAADSGLTQSAYLDVQEKFYIEWQYTDTNITILARVKTTGWFGLGFSPNGGMAGADIITAHVSNGTAYLQDRHAEGNTYPTIDQSQDVELLSGTEVDGITTIKFTRKHNTCDDKDMVVGTDTMRVIYAISPDGKDQMSYHTPYNRGTKSIYLRRKFAKTPTIPDDAYNIDIRVKDVDIPAYHTKYFCEIIRAPKLDTKHHIVKAGVILTKGNEGLVHHMILYGCYDDIDREHFFEKNQTGHDCYGNRNMPGDIDRCRAPVSIWAVGGGDTFFPEEAGYPIGDDKSPDYYMLEIHYDNPKLLSGLKDSSGMRWTVTKKLRQYDVGVFGAGTVFGLVIPPKAKDFTTSGFCTKDCTKKLFKEEVNVFGAILHGHLATRQVIARQFRDGKELRVVDEDRNYDFNYQQYKMFEKPIDMKPGDEVMVQCHYNTEDRTKMTYGDLPTTAEMCLTYMFYYPAQDVSECWSGAGMGILGGTSYLRNNLGYTKPARGSVPQILAKMTAEGFWKEDKMRQLEKDYLDYPHMEMCADKGRGRPLGSQRYQPLSAAKNSPPARDYEKECSKINKPDSVIG